LKKFRINLFDFGLRRRWSTTTILRTNRKAHWGSEANPIGVGIRRLTNGSYETVDRANIFTEITRQNALRRQSGLPVYDVRREFERRKAMEEWRQYREHRITHQDLFEDVQRKVLAERGIEDLKYAGTFTRMWVGNETTKRFEAELARRGIFKPKRPRDRGDI